jgi:hypothetical protein
VPVTLLVDPISEPPTVTVFSGLQDGRYTESASVEMGKRLYIPEPVDVELDTAIFLED